MRTEDFSVLFGTTPILNQMEALYHQLWKIVKSRDNTVSDKVYLFGNILAKQLKLFGYICILKSKKKELKSCLQELKEDTESAQNFIHLMDNIDLLSGKNIGFLDFISFPVEFSDKTVSCFDLVSSMLCLGRTNKNNKFLIESVSIVERYVSFINLRKTPENLGCLLLHLYRGFFESMNENTNQCFVLDLSSNVNLIGDGVSNPFVNSSKLVAVEFSAPNRDARLQKMIEKLGFWINMDFWNLLKFLVKHLQERMLMWNRDLDSAKGRVGRMKVHLFDEEVKEKKIKHADWIAKDGREKEFKEFHVVKILSKNDEDSKCESGKSKSNVDEDKGKEEQDGPAGQQEIEQEDEEDEEDEEDKEDKEDVENNKTIPKVLVRRIEEGEKGQVQIKYLEVRIDGKEEKEAPKEMMWIIYLKIAKGKTVEMRISKNQASAIRLTSGLSLKVFLFLSLFIFSSPKKKKIKFFQKKKQSLAFLTVMDKEISKVAQGKIRFHPPSRMFKSTSRSFLKYRSQSKIEELQICFRHFGGSKEATSSVYWMWKRKNAESSLQIIQEITFWLQ